MNPRHFIILLSICFSYPCIVSAQTETFSKHLKAVAIPLDQNALRLHQPFDLPKSLNRNFSVLGIGEQSHGTSEFFHARIALIASLGHAVTKIGLEAPMAEVEKLNLYVKEGKGDLKQILASFRLFNYECAEFVALTESIKKHNLSSKKKTQFFGFDVQSPFQSLQNISDACAVTDKATTDSLQKLIQNYHLLSNELYNHSITPEDFSELSTTSKYIFTKLDEQQAPCLNDRLTAASLSNYKQFLALNDPALSSEKQSVVRDSMMAENVLSEIQDGEKIVILAHNGHIQKTASIYSKSMGYFLVQRLGTGYQTIGMTTSSGFYTAFTPQAGKITDRNPIPPADEDAFEHQFSKIGQPVFFFKTSALTQKTDNEKIPTRYKLLPFGITDQPFVTSNLLEDFDYILHIEKTTGNQSFYLK